MDTRNTTNAFLGSNPVTGMYLGAEKVWPQETPALADILISGVARSQAQIESILTGETIAEFSNPTPGNNTQFTSTSDYSINASAFEFNSSITSYADAGKCTSIGERAFFNTTALTTALFPAATTLGSQAFQLAGIVATSFPNVTDIGYRTFFYCESLTTTSGSFPNVTSTQESAFSYCTALITASFPEVTFLGNYQFAECTALARIELPKLTGVGEVIFANALALNGTGSFGSAVTASGNWTAAEQRLINRQWQINYV